MVGSRSGAVFFGDEEGFLFRIDFRMRISDFGLEWCQSSKEDVLRWQDDGVR